MSVWPCLQRVGGHTKGHFDIAPITRVWYPKVGQGNKTPSALRGEGPMGTAKGTLPLGTSAPGLGDLVLLGHLLGIFLPVFSLFLQPTCIQLPLRLCTQTTDIGQVA